MAATSGKRDEVGRYDEATLALLRSEHLLLVPQSTPDALVVDLVHARVEDSELAQTGRARVGRHSAILGPYHLDPDEARTAGVPGAWSTVYVLQAPRERDAGGFAAYPDQTEREMWASAFPGGPPYREEGDLVALGVELARRLGGALRVEGSGAVLVPDTERFVDLTVWSHHWVDADRLLELLAPVLPGAHLDGPDPVGAHRAPPGDVELWSVDPADPRAEEQERALDLALTDDLLTRIDEVAELMDARAAELDFVLDGYAVMGDGGITVGVRREALAPLWVRRRLAELDSPGMPGGAMLVDSAAEALVSYDVRWWPDDVAQLGVERPTLVHRIARETVRAVMRATARVTAEAAHGVVLDAGGFPVDRYDLS
jgi:hypothetical protein